MRLKLIYLRMWPSLICIAFVGLLITSPAWAGQVKVAVASNFLMTARHIKKQFEKETKHKVLISAGSTGKLFAQISHGAPFEIFLSADTKRPQLLEEQGYGVKGSRFTYAIGRLSLWSTDPGYKEIPCKQVLLNGEFKRLAIANPKTAPYGVAARESLIKLGVWQKVRSKLVRGENIGQAMQYVVTGNAQLGLIATSLILVPKNFETTCRWDIPQAYHKPLRQQAIMLKKGKGNEVASAFIKFLASKRVQSIIQQNGYGIN